MKIEPLKVEAFRISEVQRLDPVTVILQDFGQGQGKIMVECWGQSWSAYWGAMGDNRSLREFIRGCEVHYIMECMIRGQGRPSKKEQAYLERILNAVCEAFKLA